MKKALSLIIAVVMVALMIPFAALTTVAADEAIYSMDFTKLTPSELTAVGQSLTLPEGWVGTKQETNIHFSSVSAENGVLLGGAGQGIAMNTRPTVEGAHVIAIKWNTIHALHMLRVGFTDSVATAAYETVSGSGTRLWTPNQIVLQAGAGPAVNQQTWWNGIGGYGYGSAGTGGVYVNGGFVGWTNAATSAMPNWNVDGLVPSTDIIVDSNGTKIDPVNARMAICQPLNNPNVDITTYIVVGEDEKVEAVYMEAAGRCIKYLPPVGTEVSASGRLAIWHTSEGGEKNDPYSLSVKSVAYYDSSYEPTACLPKANVISSYNFSDAKTFADIPYDVTDGANLDVYLEDGMLHMDNNSAGKIYHSDSVLKLDRAYFPDDGDYTIEYVLAPGAVADYLFTYFCLPNTNETGGNPGGDYEAFALQMWGTGYKAPKSYTNWSGVASNPQIFNITDLTKGDLKVQLIVEDHYLCGAIVTQETENGTLIDYLAPGGAFNPVVTPEADIGFFMRTNGEQASVAFKSIAILDDTVFTPDFNSYETKVEQVVSKDENGNYATVHDFSDALTAGEATQRTIEDQDGIRFTSTITAADLQTLVDLATEKEAIKSIEFGTLITTTPWANAAGAVTHEALDAIAGEGQVAYVEVMTSGIDAEDWYATSETVNTFAGTISNISAEREYQAVGFVRITNSYGNVITVYSGSTTASLASLAQA